MITSLRIQNLVTIEDLELIFKNGFSILTGETGTGKSIIIGGIKLVLGEKGSSDIIRTGTEQTSIEATFEVHPDTIPDEDLDTDSPGQILIHRRISENKQGKGYLNGTLVPVKKLKEIGNILVDIYGQNDHVFLRHSEYQLDYLDIYAGALPLREEVSHLVQELRRMERERKALEDKEREREQRLDFLDYQIKEIEDAQLEPDEEMELRQERNILKNAEKIRTHVESALSFASDSENSLSSQLSQLQHSVRQLLDFGQEFKDVEGEIGQFFLTLNEFTDFLIKFKEKHTASPEKLDSLEERLSDIEKLKRKYGSSIKEVLGFLEKAKKEKLELESSQEKLEELDVDIARVFNEYRVRTEKLSLLRKDSARQLEEKIRQEVTILGMKKAEFQIQVQAHPADENNLDKLKSRGNEEVEFLISPNPGEELKPLRKIASGGELSRIMLALKAVVKDADQAKTLIFDEIDSGIGGKTAEFVAQKLRSLSQKNQVVCITHLPQIASFAEYHFKIEKQVLDNRTFTTVKELGFEERVEEIARLLAGSHITEATLQNAREMLEHNLKDPRPEHQ